MLTLLPRRYQLAKRLTLALAWLAFAGGGLAALTREPVTIAAELGSVATFLWGATVFVSGAVAAAGVALSLYRLEWVAAWLACAGFAPYAATVWSIALTSTGTRLSQAFFITTLLAFCALRGISCGAHASRLRAQHDRMGT